MQTWFISGSDTGIGKTWITRALVAYCAEQGARTIQVIKPVETGVPPGEPLDARFAAAKPPEGVDVTGHTPLTFRAPLAPLEAAKRERRTLTLDDLTAAVKALPRVDVRLIEGAGGIAVPLAKDGRDWLDFALALKVDELVLVVENRLGAINQARLLNAYCRKRFPKLRLILNQREPQPADVLESTWSTLASLGPVPWATLSPEGALKLGIP